MSFLAPLFLLGALAIAGPVIFHLIRRTTKDRMRFGSLMFLEPTPPRMTKRSRIEHWLLLLLRAATLALLALAFARPFFRTQAPPVDQSAAQNRTVVLLDTSASMRRAGVWDTAQQRARKAIESAAGDSSVALVSFDTASTTLLSFDEWTHAAAEVRGSLADERVAAARPRWNGTNAATALMAAAEMLAESATAKGKREIVLVTDAQEGSRLESLQGYEWPKEVRLRIESVAPQHAGNAGLQLAAEARGETDASKGVRLRVSNSADAGVESFQLSWQAESGDGFAGPAQDVYVPPGQSRIVTLPWQAGGAKAGKVLLRGDAEDFDNVVYVTTPPSVTVPVLHSGADLEPRGPLFFLEKALPVSRALTATSVHFPANAVPPADVQAKAPLWFVTAPLGTPVAEAASAFVSKGGTVFVMLETPDMAATLQILTGTTALKIEAVKPASYAMLGTIDFGHPLFAAFAEPKFSDFTKIRFWNYCRLDEAALPGARVAAKFDSGDPAVLELAHGKGRVFILASGWEPAASQLALSSKFPSLLASLLAMTGTGAAVPAQYFAGQEGFKEPGLQHMTKDGQTREVAVNLDPSESRTTPLAVEEFEKLGAPVTADAKPAAAPGSTTESLAAATESEGRQKLWRWLLAAVFAVLFIETLLGIRAARQYTVNEGGTTV